MGLFIFEYKIEDGHKGCHCLYLYGRMEAGQVFAVVQL